MLNRLRRRPPTPSLAPTHRCRESAHHNEGSRVPIAAARRGGAICPGRRGRTGGAAARELGKAAASVAPTAHLSPEQVPTWPHTARYNMTSGKPPKSPRVKGFIRARAIKQIKPGEMMYFDLDGFTIYKESEHDYGEEDPIDVGYEFNVLSNS